MTSGGCRPIGPFQRPVRPWASGTARASRLASWASLLLTCLPACLLACWHDCADAKLSSPFQRDASHRPRRRPQQQNSLQARSNRTPNMRSVCRTTNNVRRTSSRHGSTHFARWTSMLFHHQRRCSALGIAVPWRLNPAVAPLSLLFGRHGVPGCSSRLKENAGSSLHVVVTAAKPSLCCTEDGTFLLLTRT